MRWIILDIMDIFKIGSLSCIEWRIKPCEGVWESQLAGGDTHQPLFSEPFSCSHN